MKSPKLAISRTPTMTFGSEMSGWDVPVTFLPGTQVVQKLVHDKQQKCN